MVFSIKHRFVCLCCPKTGSTTVRRFLFEHCNAREWHFLDLSETERSRRGFYGPHINHVPKQFENFFKFTVVRNPYRLMISRYNFFKNEHFPDVTFKEYVEATANNTLYRKLYLNDDYVPPKGYIKFKLDAFIKLENLRHELLQLPFVNNLDELVHYNYNPSNRALFTKETIDLVKEGMAEDFENFGYSKECPKDLIAFKYL